jgi:hypothetical protein
VIAHRPPGARWLPAAGSLGGVSRRLMLGKRLFLILQTKLQLIRRQLFGPATELVARQALNQQAQLVILGTTAGTGRLRREELGERRAVQ